MLLNNLTPVNCVTTFIYEAFVETADDAATFRRVFGATLRYLLKNLSSNEYQARIRELSTPTEGHAIKDIRMSLINSTYFCRNFKVFLLSLIYSYPQDRYALAARRKKYGITKADTKHAYRAIAYLDRCGEVDWIRQELHAHPESRSVFEIENIEAEVAKFTPILLQFCTQQVHKKLWFVYTYNNLEPSDLAVEMVCKAINAYYKMIPHSMTWDHLLNSLRRTCANHGLNLINYYTAQKRERLTNNNGDKTGKSGNSLLVMSENQIRNREVTLADVCDASPFGAVDVFTPFGNSLTVKRIAEYVQTHCSRKKQTCLQLMTGEYDKGFTQHLRMHNMPSDNDDLLEKNGFEDYTQWVAHYLGVTVPQVRNFMMELRVRFS